MFLTTYLCALPRAILCAELVSDVALLFSGVAAVLSVSTIFRSNYCVGDDFDDVHG